MALADWTIAGSGSYSVIVDGTSPGTNTSVVDINTDQVFINNTLSSAANRSIEAFIKDTVSHNIGFGLFLRCSNSTPFSGGNNYALVVSGSSSVFSVDLKRGYAGGTTLASVSAMSPLTGTITDWQKWRLSAFDSGGHAFVRVELWNGSSYIPILDAADGSPLAAGHEAFYADGIPSSHLRFDDVKIYDLA